ncbi:hypothetical protein [Tahibacter amnicola]|uniref:Uncharacterized protein n=1 Tax=Tahibacter amnicola TaxID=2976241 RepID=A0ABY6BI83_9GAMM|nr:hypothetical protein [Tahibacter amnicola]UXI69217.1 hypothetical protein N4264_06100 [Tahibacter amnicola]
MTSTPVGTPEVPSRLLHGASLFTALAVVVLVRLIVLAVYGSEIPYWDQWDGMVVKLYKPAADETLAFADLFKPHNEHVIFFTRLTGLVLFWLNGAQFDNLVEACANIGLYTAVLALVAWPWFRGLSTGALFSGAVGLVMIGAIPYGWENLVSGVQNAFYFMVGWTALALLAVARARPGRWLPIAAALACTFLSLLTLASGCLAAPAVAGAALVAFRAGRIDRRQLVVLGSVLAALFALGIGLMAPAPHHGSMHPTTVAQFLAATRDTLSWPLPASWTIAALIWWPAAVSTLVALRRRMMTGTDLFYLGIAGWVLLQCLAIGYSRYAPGATLASRYTDVLVLGVAANLILALRHWQPAAMRTGAAVATGVYVILASATLFTALGIWGLHGITKLESLRQNQAAATTHLRHFLHGAGRSAFEQATPQQVGHPNKELVARALDDATVRSLLPMAIRLPLAVDWSGCALLVAPGAFPTTPAWPAGSLGTFAAGTGNAATGTCTSATLQSRSRYLRFPVAGYLGMPRLSLALKSDDGTMRTVETPPAHEAWIPLVVRPPSDAFAFVVSDDNPEYWFAFGAPVEQGRLSYATARLLDTLRDRTGWRGPSP